MTYLNELIPALMIAVAGFQTPDGTNIVFAGISAAALLGLPARGVLLVTLAVHLLLIVL